jgi:hypothetical protein
MATNVLARKTIIDIARRRQRPGSGSSREFLQARTTFMQWPDVISVLQDTPFAVVGAVATRMYAPERHTRDLDITILPDNAKVAREKFRKAGWTQTAQLSIGGSSWRSPDGDEVDILEGREEWWPEAIAAAQENRDAQGLPILPLPYLALMKFQSGRSIDIGDITRMLGQADAVALNETRILFSKFDAEGMDDLESLITLGRMEMQ